MELGVFQSDRKPEECGPGRKDGASIRALVREGFAEGEGPETMQYGAAGTLRRKGRAAMQPTVGSHSITAWPHCLPNQSTSFTCLITACKGRAPQPMPPSLRLCSLLCWPPRHIWKPANLNFDLGE